MKWSALLLQLLLAGAAAAAQNDAIPSCRDKPLPPAADPDTELFIAIDQTTVLNQDLKQLVADNVKSFLTLGNGFTVLAFSAYTQGHYTEVLASGRLEAPLAPEVRNDIAKPVLARLDQCMLRQRQQASQLAGLALRGAFGAASSGIAKSDVLASLKAVSALVRGSRARSKVVLVVSDMLENSSVADFYADQGRAVRRIDPARELRAAEDNQLVGDFGGARVYVLGAGLLPDEGPKAKAYRDPRTMQQLGAFWSAYFSKSHAQLVEFGQPALLAPMR